ncbi:MAG: right-handed parallel beta-helix repeat-containing protein [Planctomycetota bacterium]
MVRVHAGVYRERVAPRRGGTAERPILYEAADRGRVIVSGAERWRPLWKVGPKQPRVVRGRFNPSLFEITSPQREEWPGMPAAYNPFAITLLAAPGTGGTAIDLYGNTHGQASSPHRMVVGQVFNHDQPLKQVCRSAELRRLPGSWLVDEDGGGLQLHLPSDVPDADVLRLEVTTRRCVFAPWRRGLGHIHVRGLVFERGASNFPHGFYHDRGAPQAGVLSTRSGHHWVIEHNTFRFGTSLGIDIGHEGGIDGDGLGQPELDRSVVGHHRVAHNAIVDNGAGGLAGIGSTQSKVLYNRIERNNRLGFTAPETGGIKLHFFEGGSIEGNLVRDNDCYGIWLDNMWHNARVCRNAVISNAGAGLFVELGNGPLTVDHNVIVQTRPGVREPGDGVYSHDASGVRFVHNLVADNAHFGLWAHHATDRFAGCYRDGQLIKRPTALCRDWRIEQNLFLSNHAGEIALPPQLDGDAGLVSDRNAFAGTYNRWTHETHGDALDAPRFGLCDNKGRIDRRVIVETLIERLRAAGCEDEALPAAQRLIDDPSLSLAEWQIGTDQDHESLHVSVLRLNVSARQATVAYTLGPFIQDIPTRRLDGVDFDYFGLPLSDRPMPGPWQTPLFDPALTAGQNDACVSPYQAIDASGQSFFHLWPLHTEP